MSAPLPAQAVAEDIAARIAAVDAARPVPAVLAACERHNPDGAAALAGIAVGVETLCRLSLVVPKAVHRAGFHPTAVFGAMAAAAGVGAALKLERRQLVDALGNAGSMAS